MKNEIEKIKEKLFTKKEVSNTIRKNYNPLKVNCEICKRGSRLYVKSKELKEIEESLNWKEKVIIHIFPKTFVKTYKKGIEKGFNSRL